MRKHPAVVIVGLVALYIGLAVMFLLAMPVPRGQFDYLVAGAFATGVCLLIGFAVYARAILLARKNRHPD